jgi:hypothetical protein
VSERLRRARRGVRGGYRGVEPPARGRTNKSLTIGPFGNTCEADEVSPEVEEGVVARLRCLQP